MTRHARRRAKPGLHVAVTNGRGVAQTTGPGAGLAAWLRRAAPRNARGTVAIAIVTDATIRRLNRRHRGVDQATDVLSFPAGPEVLGDEPDGPDLGDVAIASGVAGQQARELGHSLRSEVRILALHGLLHLLGYDHEGDHGRMERVEERLRRRAGLPAGLIARATRSHRPRP